MDARCGDGHIAINVLNDYIPECMVYAVDDYASSIDALKDYKKENNLKTDTS